MIRGMLRGKFVVMIFALLVGFQFLCTTPGAASAEENKFLAFLSGSMDKETAPDFELQDLNGTAFRLSQFKGERPVLIYFWATWCPSCRTIKPKISELREKFVEKDLEILAINVGEGDSLERLKRYQQGHPVSWPVLYDEGSKVSQAYGVQGIPLFLLVNKEGVVVYQGHLPPEDLREYLQ